MWLVLQTLAPIVLTIALGTVLRRTGFLAEDFRPRINRLVYYVALPCLLFVKTAQSAGMAGPALRVFLVLLGGMAVCLAVGGALVALLRVPRRTSGVFLQGAYRGNLAYVGLPVVLFGLAGLAEPSPRLESMAVLAIAPLVPIYNLVAVVVLSLGRERAPGAEGPRWGRMLLSILTNPLLLACVAGMLYAASGLGLPLFLSRSFGLLGQMALPLALLSIGMSLNFARLRGHLGLAATGAAIKVAIAPLAGLVLARWLGLDDDATLMALLYLACPTAVVSYVMAEQFGADADLAAAIVVLATLLALPALAVVLLTA